MRLYINCRRLNKITTKNQYPLLLVGELFTKLSYAKIFIKLDLRNTYYRIYIKKEDEQKTAFKTRYSYFKYLVIPFSLTNAPIIFQSYIYKALGTLVDTIYIVYLDNIFIYLNNKDKCVKHVKQILRQLRAQGLYAKLLKYIFYTKNVKFLGFIITSRGIIMDSNHVKAILRNSPNLSPIGISRSFSALLTSIGNLFKTTQIPYTPYTYILYRRIATQRQIRRRSRSASQKGPLNGINPSPSLITLSRRSVSYALRLRRLRYFITLT